MPNFFVCVCFFVCYLIFILDFVLVVVAVLVDVMTWSFTSSSLSILFIINSNFNCVCFELNQGSNIFWFSFLWFKIYNLARVFKFSNKLLLIPIHHHHHQQQQKQLVCPTNFFFLHQTIKISSGNSCLFAAQQIIACAITSCLYIYVCVYVWCFCYCDNCFFFVIQKTKQNRKSNPFFCLMFRHLWTNLIRSILWKHSNFFFIWKNSVTKKTSIKLFFCNQTF